METPGVRGSGWAALETREIEPKVRDAIIKRQSCFMEVFLLPVSNTCLGRAKD
jgi:hypothetical protein